jgi:hypothetical protein
MDFAVIFSNALFSHCLFDLFGALGQFSHHKTSHTPTMLPHKSSITVVRNRRARLGSIISCDMFAKNVRTTSSLGSQHSTGHETFEKAREMMVPLVVW